MPGRSPHRRPTPPPPLISRHSPGRGRRSPDRHNIEVAQSRGRERREYRPVVRYVYLLYKFTCTRGGGGGEIEVLKEILNIMELWRECMGYFSMGTIL